MEWNGKNGKENCYFSTKKNGQYINICMYSAHVIMIHLSVNILSSILNGKAKRDKYCK